MRKLVFLSLALAAGLMAVGTFLPVRTAGQKSKLRRSPQPVANQYIVVLNEDFVGRAALAVEVDAEAQYLTSLYGGHSRNIYSNAIKGFSAVMSPSEAERLSRDERVLFVEEDGTIGVSTTQTGAGWNLDRVDQRNLPLDSNYSYTETGAGAHVYVFDTGIRITHQEFGGRASVAYDALGDGGNGLDCNGHGTHVAGTIGGATYGLAKNALLHSVRVLSCSGNGQVSDMLQGVDWLTANRTNPAVANISVTAAGTSSVLESAITNSIASGIVYVIAAGNSAYDACSFTPARTPNAITVGASAQEDQRAPFSNFGPCVDVFAPGFQIISAGIASDSAIREMHGTSMAAPLVAGVAAIYRGANPSASSTTVRQAVLAATTDGILTDPGVGSPNKLLYSWVSGGPSPTPTPTITPTPTPTASPTPTPSPTPQSQGRIIIKKQVRGNGGPSSTAAFPYAATNISTPAFSLINNQEFVDPNVQGDGQTVVVTESMVEGWQLTSVQCVELSDGQPNVLNTTVDLANRRANIRVESGESVTCTFTSDEIAPTAGEASIGGRILDRRGRGVRGITLSLFNPRTGEVRYSGTNGFGFYSFVGVEVANYYVLTAYPTRKYTMVPGERSFTLNDDLANMDFLAESPDR